MALLNYLVAILSFKAGMHNIRPAGQMWPLEAFYMARNPKTFALSARLLDRNKLLTR